jgi:hypothetical protein
MQPIALGIARRRCVDWSRFGAPFLQISQSRIRLPGACVALSRSQNVSWHTNPRIQHEVNSEPEVSHAISSNSTLYPGISQIEPRSDFLLSADALCCWQLKVETTSMLLLRAEASPSSEHKRQTTAFVSPIECWPESHGLKSTRGRIDFFETEVQAR